jgi:hypothetical protein
MCAQTRPIDGFNLAVRHWEEQARIKGTDVKDQLPTYLLIGDDDTWINLPKLSIDIQQAYSPDRPHVVAGCLYGIHLPGMKFQFPYGGFGSIFTTSALEKFLQPIHCQKPKDEQNEFTQVACWRMEQNLAGETRFFEEGMSLAQLMHEFVAQQPMSKFDTWTETGLPGFCFHSDHSLAYFVNYYHIIAPEGSLDPLPTTWKQTEKFYYQRLKGHSECNNEKEACSTESRLCHYMKPEQMDDLHQQLLK